MAKQRKTAAAPAAPTLATELAAVGTQVAPDEKLPTAAKSTVLYVVGKVPKVRTEWAPGQRSGTIPAWQKVASAVAEQPRTLAELNAMFTGHDEPKQYPRYFVRRGWLIQVQVQDLA